MNKETMTPEGVSCMTAPDMVIAQRTKDGPYGWDRGKGTPSSRVKCWAHYNAENSGWIVVLERGGNQQLSAWVHGSADAVRRLCVRLVRWGIGISQHNSHAARRGRLALPPLPPAPQIHIPRRRARDLSPPTPRPP